MSHSPVSGKLKQESTRAVLSAVRHPRLSQDDLLRPRGPRKSANCAFCDGSWQPSKVEIPGARHQGVHIGADRM